MPVYGALRAIDPATGERKWEFRYLNLSTAGLLTTASGLIFSGDGDGNLLALDSRKREAALALPDGRDAARHVADHVHARRPAARARAGGHDAHRVGVTKVVSAFRRVAAFQAGAETS